MIEALNILEGFDLRSLGVELGRVHSQAVEALKLAYADRDTYYGDPKFNHIPTDVLLSKAYAAERRKQIGHNASLDFVPGTINGKRGKHPTEMEIARTKIDDELMASDTTCVDAIDKDGIVFSATPSGAWLPSVIAGDTGIPLTERAQQFILVPGSPNELAGGKRPRVTLSPTIVTEARQAVPGALDARRRQSGTEPDPIVLQRGRVRHERAGRRRSAALPDPPPGFELRQSRLESRRSAARRAHPAATSSPSFPARGHRGRHAIALGQRRGSGDDSR